MPWQYDIRRSAPRLQIFETNVELPAGCLLNLLNGDFFFHVDPNCHDVPLIFIDVGYEAVELTRHLTDIKRKRDAKL